MKQVCFLFAQPLPDWQISDSEFYRRYRLNRASHQKRRNMRAWRRAQAERAIREGADPPAWYTAEQRIEEQIKLFGPPPYDDATVREIKAWNTRREP